MTDAITIAQHTIQVPLEHLHFNPWHMWPIDPNCWTCGTFTSNTTRQLAKRELEAGWTIERQGDQVTRVTCPDCQGRLTMVLADKRGEMSTDKPKRQPAAKAPAKKGKGK